MFSKEVSPKGSLSKTHPERMENLRFAPFWTAGRDRLCRRELF
jgi:hypothetical protein